MSGADVVVVGGGLIGTATAWRLAQAGLDVALVVGERSLAASRVAAGMLAPVTETTFTERTLLALNQASGERWPTFADEVVDASGGPSGLRRGPTLSVASDADDLARLRTFADYLQRQGLAAERLTSRECRAHEPLLAPTVRGGLLVPSDWSCDNRVLLEALTTAAERTGVRTVTGFVKRVESDADRVTGVTLVDGTTLAAGSVVLANGSWAAQVEGVPDVPVRPVKGQVLRLDPGRLPGPGLTVRAFSRGNEVYVVPREHGREVVVGATVEEQGFDDRVTAGGVYELLRDARQVIPLSAEYAIAETNVGWRPGTPDNAPILGPCALEGLTLATGHHRNGVLLTPVTADVTAAYVTTGVLDPVAEPFALGRFDREPAPTRRLRTAGSVA
ncbi:glycine oxidase [Microlunatus sagamiharensis]|uniref:glycine oxidase n=1 Tax=Microlunatus sagamiharensis TaxID=546874 RepID=A0A1H2MQ84_9ACTN|nr:glycine oxidase ThiO [Microlunatus sagamiharensis]SDU95389.1 glycine oxidase [Microlunatus sagamiharensis]